MKTYTKDDVGCWIDGAFEHGRAKLSYMLAPHKDDLSACPACDSGQGECSHEHFAQEDVEECIAALEGPMSDDNWETDFATESLLPALTATGLVWMWDAGDLILTTEDQLED